MPSWIERHLLLKPLTLGMQIHAFSGKNGKDLNIVPAQIWHSVNVATVCQLALWQKTEIVFFFQPTGEPLIIMYVNVIQNYYK